MIEVAIRDYLAQAITPIPVLMEQPKTLPTEYVLLRLADGGIVNKVDAATFFVTVRSNTLYKAAQLRDSVKEALLNAISEDFITSSTLGGESAQTDSANNVYQYELTFNFYYYREET
jgi:hypothetical protein